MTNSQERGGSVQRTEANNGQPSRRDFLAKKLKAGAALATLAVAAPSYGQDGGGQQEKAAQEPAKSTAPKLRIGVVGCGGRGMGALGDSLTINENVHVVALADLDENASLRAVEGLVEQFDERGSVVADKIYSGLDAYKRMLEDPDVDIVYLTTSPGFRPRHIAEAVDAGKHIFAEKPTCVDPAGYHICLAAHDKAVANGTAIVTGTQYRRQVNYIEAVKKIHEGAIGDIISMTSRYCSSSIWYRERDEGMSELDYQLKNWMHFIWLSGDQIVEQSVHNIDVMNWVMGSPPESAFASGGRFHRPEDSQMWDAMSVDYTYPGDRVVSFKNRTWPNCKTDNRNVIYGTEGTMHIGAINKGSKMLNKKGEEVWSCDGKISDAYKQEHKDLVDSIVAGKPIVELKQTADSSLAAVMGRMAAYAGQEIDWDFVSKESTLNLFPEGLNENTVLKNEGPAVPGVTQLV